MDDRRFDAVARALGRRGTRRSVLGGLAAGALAIVGAGRAEGSNECAEFCKALPPGQARGECVSSCAQGGGPYAECGGDPARLCVAEDGTATCCAAGGTCSAGTCSCPEYYVDCPVTRACMIDNCAFNDRKVFDPETCQCTCQPDYVMLPGGGCGIACETSADCPTGRCGISAGGEGFCTSDAYLPYCTPCDTDEDCYLGCSAINIFCEDTICRGVL